MINVISNVAASATVLERVESVTVCGSHARISDLLGYIAGIEGAERVDQYTVKAESMEGDLMAEMIPCHGHYELTVTITRG